jgi:hypothetical protein
MGCFPGEFDRRVRVQPLLRTARLARSIAPRRRAAAMVGLAQTPDPWPPGASMNCQERSAQKRRRQAATRCRRGRLHAISSWCHDSDGLPSENSQQHV